MLERRVVAVGLAILDRVARDQSFAIRREQQDRQQDRQQDGLTNPAARVAAKEAAVYDDLRFDRLQPRLRLEQERVGFGWLTAELRSRLRRDR
jgi:hypothetical protein